MLQLSLKEGEGDLCDNINFLFGLILQLYYSKLDGWMEGYISVVDC